jgi:hypothetical protein
LRVIRTSDDSLPSTPRPVVVVRSPTIPGPRPKISSGAEDALPMERLPLGILAEDEHPRWVVRPRVLALLPVPALLAGAVALASLEGFGAAAHAGSPLATRAALFLFAILAFSVGVALWARVLGLGLLVLLPLAYFGSVVAVLVVSSPFAPNGSINIGAIVLAELFVLAVLGTLLPALAGLVAWRRAAYAITNRRAIEVSGIWRREVRDLPLARVNLARSRLSWWGRWLGFGTVFLLERDEVAPWRRAAFPLTVRDREAGLVFLGILDPAGAAETILSLRDAKPAPVVDDEPRL